MKMIFFSFMAVFLCSTASAQLKTTVKCPEIDVNLLKGIVNNTILPVSDPALIRHNLPCETGLDVSTTTNKCGGGVFYKSKDIYFYTDRDYVEIGPAFKGKLSIPLMGAAKSGLFKYLGAPQMKETNWEAFETSYGILIVYFNKQNRVNKIQFSTKTAKTIQLCN
jgi:hypothetical protein